MEKFTVMGFWGVITAYSQLSVTIQEHLRVSKVLDEPEFMTKCHPVYINAAEFK